MEMSTMSRGKSRLQSEICGDCTASDPSWASINKCILLCSDCCSVHRSLGRHISIVKSLRQGVWEPSVLNFVNSLNAHGANSVWEHHLLDAANKTNARRKPSPKDPLHPTKSEFIKAKHVNLAFALKPNFQDDDVGGSNLESELSKQLHASVRTSNLETSLRLLAQGADPNFFHEEKRSTPLHVAAKFGQASQIELLIVYGADLNAIDGNVLPRYFIEVFYEGTTPYEVAKANNHNVIAERLIDAMYDVTDRIIMFLGGKKQDHLSGRHLVIPDAFNTEISEQLKIARGRLQLVPNKMFEELVMDLYDEVDRRENEAIWATTALNQDNVAVPFLPANPFLSATRNQGRQKLARFSRTEFAGLLTDVLIDALRRQNMANLRPLDAQSSSPPTAAAAAPMYSGNSHQSYCSSDDEPIYDPVAPDDDYAPIAQQARQNNEMETLRKQINDYVTEINQLKNVVQKLSTENSELKSKFSGGNLVNMSYYDEPLRIDSNGVENENEPVLDGKSTIGTSTSSVSSCSNQSQSTNNKRPASMYERRMVSFTKPLECRTTTSMYQVHAASKSFDEDVKNRTDLVTRRLKELIVTMQQDILNNKDAFVPCAERIRVAVAELTDIFNVQGNCNEIIKDTLKLLNHYNILIQSECENLQNSLNLDDAAAIDKYMKEVRDCAYYIASATKTLVMQFE